MKKTWTAAVLAALVCFGASGAGALTMTGLETETVAREWEESLFFPRMEALTGIAVQAHGVTKEAEYTAMLNDMLHGKMPADVLFKANLTRAQETALLDSGAIVDLAPMIADNMPNLTALFEAHPDWRDSVALQDGRIASLPLLNAAERQVCVYINRAWLDKLGLTMPQTLEELETALTAMKDGDPNGNGKADERAVDVTGVFEMRWLLPYFGIVADDSHLMRDADGQIVFAPEAEGYRAFVETLRRYTEKGLIPSDAFTALHGTSALGASEDQQAAPVSGLLVSLTPYTAVSAEYVTDYEALLLAGPDGRVRWRDFLGPVWTGCFAVTGACKDPAQALRWADALYGEEGALLGYAGLEGEEYAEQPDGSWKFLVNGARTVNEIRSSALMYTGVPMPGLYPSAFITRVDSKVDRHVFAQSEKARSVSERVTRAYALPSEAQRRADELAEKLGHLVDIGIARFATGETELSDETYAAWLAQLREAGSDELVALYREK